MQASDPLISRDLIAQELEGGPRGGAADGLALFRDDPSHFIRVEVANRADSLGPRKRPPVSGGPARRLPRNGRRGRGKDSMHAGDRAPGARARAMDCRGRHPAAVQLVGGDADEFAGVSRQWLGPAWSPGIGTRGSGCVSSSGKRGIIETAERQDEERHDWSSCCC